MIAILSPAMNMKQNFEHAIETTQPVFSGRAEKLVDVLRAYSPWELESLLCINAQLAMNAFEAYCDFGAAGVKMPAVLAFHGLAYQNLNPQGFSPGDFEYANDHLRILSSLYGLLRPNDSIHPYRLDFVCRFGKQKKLYDHWGASVCRELFRRGDTVVNLCSGEYEKLIIPHLTATDRLISCRFLVNKAGKLRCQATASKMARGQMARFIIKNRIEDPEQLRAFDWDEYEFCERMSSQNELVFWNNLR